MNAMKASIHLLVVVLGLGVGLATAHSMPGTGMGIYAIIDEVTFEPSDFEPERIWISGVFVVPKPVSSGLYLPPARGGLYFSLNSDAPRSTRADWEALREVAGTGQVAGFGQYWTLCVKLRSGATRFRDAPANTNCSFEASVHTDRTLAVPQPYLAPSSEGVVTAFDGQDAICVGAAQIALDLREAHSPGSVHSEPPVCIERIGLVSSSELDSEFVAQSRDSEWADAAEALILQRFADAPALALSELGVECRNTICHVRLVFPNREYQEAVGDRLAANALSELPGFAQGAKIIPPRDAPTIDYYVQRRKPSSTQTSGAVD